MLLCCLGFASCEPGDRFYNVFHYEPESPNEYPMYYDLNGELAEKGFQMENVVLCREQHDEGTDCYYAVFPEENYVDLHDYGLEIRLPQYQCHGRGIITAAYNPLVSYGVIREQRHRHVNGGMEVRLRGNARITAIRFTDNDTLNRLWGNFVVRRVGSEKQCLLSPPWSDGNNEIWLNYPDGVLLSPDSTSLFSVMLPPGAFYRGFSMDVFCGDSLLYHVATEKDCTIRRNVVMKMPVMEIYLILK